MADDTAAIVGDIGSLHSKFGMSGEEGPSFVLPSHVGMLDKDYLVGDVSMRKRRDEMALHSPLENGVG